MAYVVMAYVVMVYVVMSQDWRRTDDVGAILTTYPLALQHEDDREEYELVPRICGYDWS